MLFRLEIMISAKIRKLIHMRKKGNTNLIKMDINCQKTLLIE